MTFGDEPSTCYFDVVLVGDSLIADAPVARVRKVGWGQEKAAGGDGGKGRRR